MPLKVTVNLSGYPEDEEVAISGLGRVKNGGTIEVDEAMEQAFYAAQGRTVQDAFEASEEVEVEGDAEWNPPVEPEETQLEQGEELSEEEAKEVVEGKEASE